MRSELGAGRVASSAARVGARQTVAKRVAGRAAERALMPRKSEDLGEATGPQRSHHSDQGCGRRWRHPVDTQPRIIVCFFAASSRYNSRLSQVVGPTGLCAAHFASAPPLAPLARHDPPVTSSLLFCLPYRYGPSFLSLSFLSSPSTVFILSFTFRPYGPAPHAAARPPCPGGAD